MRCHLAWLFTHRTFSEGPPDRRAAELGARVSSLGDHTIDEPEATLGQAWLGGVLVLSWAAILRDTRTSANGNVIIHEMAHILDAEDGIFDGIPLHDDPDQGARWAQTLRREFELHRAAVDAGKNSSLNDYAASNHAEFFAVATEAFFCTPDRLRKHLPDLSFQLGRFFRDERDESMAMLVP